mmetsp:Transcript_4739/g.12423  ORF Transcript_4739/g.12423 Transcript_4739/m.12423 type:complete len:196 (-) Transcript_4739:361-948(-)
MGTVVVEPGQILVEHHVPAHFQIEPAYLFGWTLDKFCDGGSLAGARIQLIDVWAGTRDTIVVHQVVGRLGLQKGRLRLCKIGQKIHPIFILQQHFIDVLVSVVRLSFCPISLTCNGNATLSALQYLGIDRSGGIPLAQGMLNRSENLTVTTLVPGQSTVDKTNVLDEETRRRLIDACTGKLYHPPLLTSRRTVIV